MMAHYVKPTIEPIYGLRVQFVCTEEPGSDCHITCPTDPKNLYGCEVYTMERDENGVPWHTGYDEDGNDAHLHQMVPTDRCLILEWDDLSECYAGEPGPLREGEIAFSWTGDGYEWRYVSDEGSV